MGEHNRTAYISELCVFVCALEHSPVWWLHYVPGLWPQAAAGPEACGGRQTQNERGAQRRQNKGLISLLTFIICYNAFGILALF